MFAVRTVVATGVALSLGMAVSAQTVYETDFESPFFVGPIGGQDGWVNGSSSGVSQNVIDSFSQSGSQSLQWDNTSVVSFYSVRRPMDGQNGAISPTTPLVVSTWLYIDPSSEANRLYGLYAMNGGTSTLGGTNLGITVSGDGTIRAGNTWSSTYTGSAALFTDASLVGNWIQLRLTYDGTDGTAAVLDASNSEVFSVFIPTVNLANANGSGTTWGVNLGADYVLTTARTGIGYHDDLAVFVDDGSGPADCLGDIADDFGFTADEGGGPDGQVDFGDFVALLGLIGPCPGGPGCLGDIADDFGFTADEGGGPDGQVDFGDFVALLGLIGPCP